MSAKVGEILVKIGSFFSLENQDLCNKVALKNESQKWRRRALQTSCLAGVALADGVMLGFGLGVYEGTKISKALFGGINWGFDLSTITTSPVGWVALGCIGLGLISVGIAFIFDSIKKHYESQAANFKDLDLIQI